MSTKQVRILLDCEHERWFTAGTLPNLNEDIYCPSCRDYVPAGPSGARMGESIIDGQWISTPTKGGYRGSCGLELDGQPCAFTHKERHWHTLRNKMDAHHMRVHVKSRFVPQFETGAIPTRYPPGSPPPF